MLSEQDLERFIAAGYVKLEAVFDECLAEEARSILWKDTGCDPEDRSTWIKPVIRLGGYEQEPFRRAANMPVLHAAFDQLVGKGRWQRLDGLGTFPVRFPSHEEPRFMAQPPLLPAEPIQLVRARGDYSLVEEAIRMALDQSDRDMPSSRPLSSASPRKRPMAE